MGQSGEPLIPFVRVDRVRFCVCALEYNINPLKPKLVFVLFMNSVRTSKRTPHFTITKINFLTLFKKIITVYVKNHSKPTNTK
jgi:hypothetical protein